MNKALMVAVIGAIAVSMIAFSCSNSAEAKPENPTVAQKAKIDTEKINQLGQVKQHPTAAVNKKVMAQQKGASPSKKAGADPFKAGGLNWLTMEEASKLKGKDNKKFLVDVYTDWCGWCKVMDKNTFTDPAVQEYLNKNYHLVKFNAEQKEPVNFLGKSYEWTPAGRKGVNKLAMEILGGRMSYPSMVYFDNQLNKIKVSPGYKKPDQLLAELKVLDNS